MTTKQKPLSNILKAVSDIYYENLKNHKDVITYLVETRKLDIKIIDEFRIGYSSNNLNKNLKNSFRRLFKKHKEEDFFFGYITFPIFDERGYYNIYGRTFLDNKISHLTLPDIEKDQVYNQNALSKESVIITESPIDCLTLVQNKINAVSVLTSKVSTKVAPLFKGKNCYIIFDKDESGKHGADVSIRNLSGIAKNIFVISLPGKNYEKVDINSYFNRTPLAKDRIRFLIKNSAAIKPRKFIYSEKKIKKNNEEDKLPIVAVAKILLKDENYLIKGDKLWVRCPKHKGGKEVNKSLLIGGKKNIFYCFGCHKGGGVLELVKWCKDFNLTQAIDWIKQNY